jgi:hypothetical protein
MGAPSTWGHPMRSVRSSVLWNRPDATPLILAGPSSIHKVFGVDLEAPRPSLTAIPGGPTGIGGGEQKPPGRKESDPWRR